MSHNFLLPGQRHLRHARAIYARKLQATAAIDTFITISVKINNDTKVIYQSKIYEGSINPTWTFDEVEFVDDDTPLARYAPACKQCSISLYKSNGDKPELISSTIFNFDTVVFVGENMASLTCGNFPHNTMLIEFIDGVFISQHTAADTSDLERDSFSFSQPLLKADASSARVTSDQVHATIVKIIGVKYAIQETDTKIEQHKTCIDKLLEKRKQVVELKQQIELRKSRIRRLKLDMEEKKTFIEHETQYLNQKHAERANRMTFVTESNQTLQQQQLRLQDQQQNVLPKLKEHLMILEARTKQRQKVIVRLLQVIYPITTHGKLNHWLINGLAIYKGEQLGADEETAAALGYVAHCVRILSKLYQIPLKYQVFPLVSRSFVRDDGVDQQQKLLLPLFLLRGSERPKYYKAVFLLNLNIYYISKAKGLKGTTKILKNKFDVLENLNLLFQQCLSL